MSIKEKYWTDRYISGATQWDVGSITTPIKEYIDQLADKDIKILIPGCGNAYEAQYAYAKGFKNVFIIDISEKPIVNFMKQNPTFPENQALIGDFFELDQKFDLIIEQTFFCALDPSERKDYARKMQELLTKNGRLAGVLFNVQFNNAYPPYGGNKEEYRLLFSNFFRNVMITECYNSIEPRKNNEVFIICKN